MTAQGELVIVVCVQVLAFVQNSLGEVASTAERAKNVLNFSEPFMSWIAVLVLLFATAVLYFVPVRALLMIWGVHKFSKKILRSELV